jgi:maltose alpha-D-glucosyltransferase/alpha-amylase
MDATWYKDAIFYQLHVKAYYDSDGDGIGDFRGLAARLDHIQDLGADVVWLLPFYPSPFKDDGYDIADYRGVHPAYGTLKDFRQFIKEAHRRGLKVVTELVINHTSDQHPWFQRARRARPGSAARDYYVWSETNRKYAGTRIIFTDTEKSNWAWDDEAGAYYWHRFFAHQPDLNFDNPRVVREVVQVMRHWLDLGVDGMRLDAVPYLCEREGTSNENLPETHAILKRLRGAMDHSHPGRMFLAEANQWPEDVLPYFGEGDECHMAFHFPLMPRMYMAIAREDRRPITDIMRQTPDIPANCQWAVFLRNHDELTLEMVTDRERDYLWNTYAADRRARINLGIRRRLAPLMDNDRRRIELIDSLLFSMPGTPVLYYGDEIGMGDNTYLGDRNGVRTPMQWSADRNGGFSRADPASLYLPPIMDPVYGFEAINVEAQRGNPSSLLNWTRRMAAVRRRHRCFGRGTLRFLYPANRKVLAYLREHEGETVLCVANLARTAQGVELDLGAFRGRVPVEMTGQSAFPPISELPYFLTLPGHGFYWFLLDAAAEPPAWHEERAEMVSELFTLVVREGFPDLGAGHCRRVLEHDVLPPWLALQRWFGERGAACTAELLAWVELAGWMLALVSARHGDGGPARYFLPLAMSWPEAGEDSVPAGGFTLARLRRGPRVGALLDAFGDDSFLPAVVEAMRSGAVIGRGGTRVAFHASRALAGVALDSAEVRRMGGEQSNSSAMVGGRVVVKLYRKPGEGANPEVEIGRFLAEVSPFANTPALLGWAEWSGDGPSTVLAVMHAFVANQGSAWDFLVARIEHFLDVAGLTRQAAAGVDEASLALAVTIGTRTAQMHKALAVTTGDPDFDPVDIAPPDLERWRLRAHEQARLALAAIAGSDLAEAAALRGRAEDLFAAIDAAVPAAPFGIACRIHGDYHLGQLLVADGDVHVVDFEGEPARPADTRRAKDSPLRDVAGMLRSFDYAVATVLPRIAAARPEAPALLSKWRDGMSEAFLAAYMAEAGAGRALPVAHGQAPALIDLFVLEKACYEVRYEAAHRPAWLGVPLAGVLGRLQ